MTPDCRQVLQHRPTFNDLQMLPTHSIVTPPPAAPVPEFVYLDSQNSVSSQLETQHLMEAAAAGFNMIANYRPDTDSELNNCLLPSACSSSSQLLTSCSALRTASVSGTCTCLSHLAPLLQQRHRSPVFRAGNKRFGFRNLQFVAVAQAFRTGARLLQIGHAQLTGVQRSDGGQDLAAQAKCRCIHARCCCCR